MAESFFKPSDDGATRNLKKSERLTLISSEIKANREHLECKEETKKHEKSGPSEVRMKALARNRAFLEKMLALPKLVFTEQVRL